MTGGVSQPPGQARPRSTAARPRFKAGNMRAARRKKEMRRDILSGSRHRYAKQAKLDAMQAGVKTSRNHLDTAQLGHSGRVASATPSKDLYRADPHSVHSG